MKKYDGGDETGLFLIEEAGTCRLSHRRNYLCEDNPVGGTSGVVAGAERFRFFTGGAALGGRCLPLPLPLFFLSLVSMTARIQ